jgi:hypothetical protein
MSFLKERKSLVTLLGRVKGRKSFSVSLVLSPDKRRRKGNGYVILDIHKPIESHSTLQSQIMSEMLCHI